MKGFRLKLTVESNSVSITWRLDILSGDGMFDADPRTICRSIYTVQ